MSNTRRPLQRTFKKSLPWLVLLLSSGLFGFRLLRKKTTLKANSFDLINGSKYFVLKPFIIAQSKVESANYSSNLFERSNNAFGMKNANQRSQLGYAVAGDSYRHYDSLEQSIQDFILWLDYTKFPLVNDVNSYARALKDRNYFESSQSDYINALNSWI